MTMASQSNKPKLYINVKVSKTFKIQDFSYSHGMNKKLSISLDQMVHGRFPRVEVLSLYHADRLTDKDTKTTVETCAIFSFL